MFKALLVFIVSLYSFLIYAIPEENYQQQYNQQVRPYFLNHFEVKSFLTEDGVALKSFYLINNPDAPTLVFLAGRTESFYSYQELFYDLRTLGLNIIGFDWRGQGMSERLLLDPDKGHVDRFSDYINDMHFFLKEYREDMPNSPFILLAHSMGAHLSARYELEYPRTFNAMILSAPMLDIHTGSIPPSVARYIIAREVRKGRGDRYARNQGPYDWEAGFEDNVSTSSLARFTMKKNLALMNPQIVTGGPTNQWVHESFRSMDQMKSNWPSMQAPVLMFTAEIDHVVQNEAQKTACDIAPECQQIIIPESLHNVLQETDAIRNPALQTIKQFIQQQVAPKNIADSGQRR